MNPAPRVTTLAKCILAESNLLDGAYFAALESGAMSLEQFRVSQAQFFYAVQYYARPIAALISRLPDPTQRLDLVHNLVEEHGNFDEAKFHPTTFGRFLASIGGQRPDVGGVAIGPVVHAFNATLIGACTGDDVETGISCLGIIELAFAGVSAAISQLVVKRGWMPADQVVHYALHAGLDVEHAHEFFAMVEPVFDDPCKRAPIERGLRLGAYALERLYRDLAEDALGPRETLLNREE